MIKDNYFGEETPGMQLRDYFAAAALTGMMFSPTANTKIQSSEFARNAYIMADAMLKARMS